MANERQRLEAILTQIDAQILDMTTNPKPDYGLAGQSVSWSSYFSSLMEKRSLVKEAIQQAGQPFCVVSRART